MVNANIATNILKRTKTYINKAKSTSASIFKYPETTSYAKSIRLCPTVSANRCGKKQPWWAPCIGCELRKETP
jgi:hypothetical protein